MKQASWSSFLPLLLDHAEAAGAKGDEPSVVAEGRDPDPGSLGCLKDHLPPFNLDLDAINLQFDGLTLHHDLKME